MLNNEQLDKLNRIFHEEIVPVFEENPELVEDFMKNVEEYYTDDEIRGEYMKFEYDSIYKTVRYMQEEYSFRHSKEYFSLLDLLNEIGKDGWELLGSIEGKLIVKRQIK